MGLFLRLMSSSKLIEGGDIDPAVGPSAAESSMWTEWASFDGLASSAVSRSAAVASVVTSDRIRLVDSLRSLVLGGTLLSNNLSSRRSLWDDTYERSLPSAAETVVPAGKLAKFSRDVVSWVRPTWSNTVLSASIIKFSDGIALEKSGFDPGFHRAMKRDRAELGPWAYIRLQQASVLHCSWLFEELIHSLSLSAWAKGHFAGNALAGPPEGAGRARFLEDNPGGLNFPEGSIVWGGDTGGFGARVPFARRRAEAAVVVDGAEAAPNSPVSDCGGDGEDADDIPVGVVVAGGLTPYSGRRLYIIAADAILDFAESPALIGADERIFVSRVRSPGDILREIVHIGVVDFRGNFFPENGDIFLILPLAIDDVVVQGLSLSGIRWRRGMGMPLAEVAAHLTTLQEGAYTPTAEVHSSGMTVADAEGALRVLADMRTRFGNKERPSHIPEIDTTFLCVLPSWWMRVSSALGYIGADLPTTRFPVGEELAAAVTVYAYRGREWVTASVQRTVGSAANIRRIPGSDALMGVLRAAVAGWSRFKLDGERGGWASAIASLRPRWKEAKPSAGAMTIWRTGAQPRPPDLGMEMWPSGDVTSLPIACAGDHSAVEIRGVAEAQLRNLVLRSFVSGRSIEQRSNVAFLRDVKWEPSVLPATGEHFEAFRIPLELIGLLGGVFRTSGNIRCLTPVSPFWVVESRDSFDPPGAYSSWDF